MKLSTAGMKRQGIWVAASLLLAGTVQAAPGAPAQTATAAAPAAAAPAATTRVNPDAIRVLLSPELETTLVAQTMGRISSLQASLGSRVVKGRPVVTFDCGEAAARLRMAQAEYDSARETHDVKKRLRALDAAGDMEVTLAESAAERGKAQIALARVQVSQCTVPAPFTGRVVRIHVKPHQGVNAGAPLVELVSDGPLKLRLNVPSRLLRTLKTGTPFEVDIDETGRSYPAKVTAINARVDAVAQTVELEARLDGKHDELLAGMSGNARFKAAQ